jgi:hypothetical protein
VLNPETNSLSPSAKSKGVRLVSANKIINHIKNNLGKISSVKFNSQGLICFIEIKFKLMSKDIIIKIRLIS